MQCVRKSAHKPAGNLAFYLSLTVNVLNCGDIRVLKPSPLHDHKDRQPLPAARPLAPFAYHNYQACGVPQPFASSAAGAMTVTDTKVIVFNGAPRLRIDNVRDTLPSSLAQLR